MLLPPLNVVDENLKSVSSRGVTTNSSSSSDSRARHGSRDGGAQVVVVAVVDTTLSHAFCIKI